MFDGRQGHISLGRSPNQSLIGGGVIIFLFLEGHGVVVFLEGVV